ncbi:MAG: phosphatase PAP2 family protein [Hyphomicrobium sp.]
MHAAPWRLNDDNLTISTVVMALNRPLVILLLITTCFSAVVVLHPEIDAQISALFYRPGVGFPLAADARLLNLRWLGRALPAAVIFFLIVLLAWRFMRRQPLDVLSDRALAFVVSCFAIGPGLLVNAFFKTHWGRSRPLATDLFGGTAHFTPAWWPWGDCLSNCSFVSGEASTAAVLFAFATVSGARYRRPLSMAVGLWTVAISLNRMAFGAHYFSDVVLSCCLTLLVVFALKGLLLRVPTAPSAT